MPAVVSTGKLWCGRPEWPQVSPVHPGCRTFREYLAVQDHSDPLIQRWVFGRVAERAHLKSRLADIVRPDIFVGPQMHPSPNSAILLHASGGGGADRVIPPRARHFVRSLIFGPFFIYSWASMTSRLLNMRHKRCSTFLPASMEISKSFP